MTVKGTVPPSTCCIAAHQLLSQWSDQRTNLLGTVLLPGFTFPVNQTSCNLDVCLGIKRTEREPRRKKIHDPGWSSVCVWTHKYMRACFIILSQMHMNTYAFLKKKKAAPLLRSPPRPHRSASSGGLAPSQPDWLLRPAAEERQGSQLKPEPYSWQQGGVDWQWENTNRTGSNANPSGIVGGQRLHPVWLQRTSMNAARRMLEKRWISASKNLDESLHLWAVRSVLT